MAWDHAGGCRAATIWCTAVSAENSLADNVLQRSANPASAKTASTNSTAALAIGDVVVLEKLPEGFVLEDAQLIVSTGMTASATGSLGFLYADGVDSAAVPQDAAYFGAGLNAATAARIRTAGAKAPAADPKPEPLPTPVEDPAMKVQATGQDAKNQEVPAPESAPKPQR